jgi:excisionase family DNA binding protein
MSAVVPERRLLTLSEVGEALHYSERTVRRLIEDHGLPVLRLGGPGSAPRIPADKLDEWLDERTVEKSAMGGGSFAGESAMGHGSFAGAGDTPPSRPQSPAAHGVRGAGSGAQSNPDAVARGGER